MKRFLALLSIFLTLFLISACGASSPGETTQPMTLPEPDRGIRNIIIVIGDGMGDNHIACWEKTVGRQTVFHDWQQVHANTNCLASDGISPTKTTDSAAAGTALATGQLTAQSRIGRDFKGDTDLQNIMEYAMDHLKSTGVISTDAVFGATPAAFSGHAYDRDDSTTIMYTQAYSNINLFCANIHKDTTEMISVITGNGYTYIMDPSKLSANLSQPKLYCQLGMAGHNPSVRLRDVIPTCLDYLDQDPDGFVLMIEQAHIDKYSHSNDLEYAVDCVGMLDEGVCAILDWIGDRTDTAVIVTADHETGGLTQNEEGSFFYTSDTHSQAFVSVYTYGFTPDYTDLYLEEGVIKNTSVFTIAYDLLINPLQD